MSRPTSKTRALALVISTVLGLLGVEWGLRWVYPYLPSISALQGSDFRLERLVDLAEDPDLSLCHEVRTFLSHRSRWAGPGAASGVHFAELGAVDTSGDGRVSRFGSGTADRRLWIAGDSLAYGLGVTEYKTMGAELARAMTRQTGGAVDLRNLAVPGAGYCTVAQRVAGAVSRNEPDLVLVVLSADDLEERLMLSVNGVLVAPPDLASGQLTRWMVGRSWFANLLWFRFTAWREATDGGRARFVGRDTQVGFQRAMASLKARIEAKGGVMVAAIVEPPGMPLCAGALMQERCGWLREDMATMATLLTAAGITHMTADGLWSGSMEHIIDREHRTAQQGMLAMHPSALGHERIAEAVWPMLKSAM
jgi:lysophospholipase L1-like esterase